MPENYIDRIVRAKLLALEVPLEPADWEAMLEQLNDSFYQIIKDRLESLQLPYEEANWGVLVSELDEAFDQSMRETLHSLSLTPQPEDWPLMASEIAGNPLDLQIAKKISSLSFPVLEEDWAHMQAELDQDPLLTTSRQLLSQHTLAFEAEDWALFEQQMDDAFDLEIQEKLGNWELPLPAEDWASMATILDGNSFDESFRETFDSYTVPTIAADWELMAEKLEAPFDSLVSAKLESLNLPVASGDWRAMSQKLDRDQDRVPFYFRWQSYAVAAAVALLLLFSSLGLLNNWSPNSVDSADSAIAQGSDPTPNQPSSPTVSNTDTPTSPLDSYTESEVLSDSNPIQLVSSNPSETLDSKSKALYISPLDQQLSKNQEELYGLDPNIVVPDAPSVLMSVSDQYNETKEVSTISRIPVRENSLSSPLFRQSGLDLFDPMYNRPRPEVSISLYGATARTRAELNDVAEKVGYTSGLRIRMKINDGWHLVTGFLYGKKSFSHKYPISDPDYPGFFGKVYGDLTVVEVPLLMRYEFPEVNKFTIYGQAGIVTVVSLEETYENHDPLSPINASLISRRVDPDMLAAETHIWNLNTYPGNIHAAIGLRYAISRQLSMELEPYFQQSLQRTKGSTSLRHRKKLYTSGIGASLIYTFPSESP